MSLATIILLALVVVVVAYLLGMYFRRDGDAESGPPRIPRLSKTLSAPRALRLPGRGDDRATSAVIKWLLSQAFEQTGVKVADEKIAYERIVEAAHRAIQELRTQETTTISLPFLTADATGPKHFETRLTREVIDELVRY